MEREMSQFETRARMDAELTEAAYHDLGDSVLPSKPGATRRADCAERDVAACACLDYLGVASGAVPEGVDDPDERLEYLCRPSGTMRRQVTLDEGWQRRSFGPMIASLDTGETVALVPSKFLGYWMLDPSVPSKKHVTRQVAAHIDPKATLIYRPLPAKALGFKDLVRFTVGAFDAGDYLRVIVAAIVATLVGLLPAAVKNLVFSTVIPSGTLKYVLPIACLLVGVSVSKTLINACRNFMMARISIKLNVTCEAATYARLLMLPPSFFRDYEGGDLAMRVSQVSQLVQAILTLVLGSGFTGLLSLVYLVQIWAYTPTLALPAFIIVVAEIVLTIAFTLVDARYERRSTEANATLSGTVTALLGGVTKVKLAGAERRAFARWAKGYAPYANASYNRPWYVKSMSSIVTLVNGVGLALIYFIAGSSAVSVADYMSFSVAYGMMLSAVSSISSVATQVSKIEPLYKLVEPILSAVPEVADDKPVVGDLSGDIEVSGVSFRYAEGSPYVLQDLSFSVRAGEYVAIVGKSGCGKSTLVRLLLGFERPELGSVFYGPYDVGKVDLRSLRRSIGTVMQDSGLFSGSIFSNITVSTPTATLDDAWKAAELAGIADDIRKMPMGMQTQVSEGGGGISGGQRQRIMIARAICGQRKILILDEATSALDNETQRQVTDALESLGCTRIAVAHRLSTVKHCDRILVLDGGRIAEEGSYDELIARGGIFSELVSRQQLEGA